jgi:hypothetical protein
MCKLYEDIEKCLAITPWRDADYVSDYSRREKLTQVVAAKRLRTRAVDNHGNKYEVYLYMTNLPSGFGPTDKSDDKFRNDSCYKWILRIKNTPGGWYMTTLLNFDRDHPVNQFDVRESIAIDAGAKWDCVNFHDVLNEAKRLI